MTGVQLALDIPLPPPRDRHRTRPRGVVPADRTDARWIRTPTGLRPIHNVPTRGLL